MSTRIIGTRERRRSPAEMVVDVSGRGSRILLLSHRVLSLLLGSGG